ncbi:MAG: HNH endonuclease, partial [Comamonas sp.]|nr:HNH endonuclease [Comamonas sp.]
LNSQPRFNQVLELVQNFIWRRFILGLPTNGLNKIFMNLHEKIDPKNYLYSLQKSLVLRQGSQKFPTDKEVYDALYTKDLYNIKTKNRSYLLERLENFNNHEFVQIEQNEKITTEHIFPQNPDPKWKLELGEKVYKQIREKFLHTLANLTLSGNNGKLGNRSFNEKRELPEGGYKDSRLWLNRFLAEQNGWDIIRLKQRFELLAERFFQVWAYPDIGNIALAHPASEISIFEAEDPVHKKLDCAISLDSKLEIKNFTKLYIKVISELFEISPERFYSSSLGVRVGLVYGKSQANQLRNAMGIGKNYFIETNFSSVEKFDRIKYALTVFELEDELFIKYAAD